jgi:hypothetical protein
MKAFVVFVNGERLCTAGIGDNGVLSAIVNWVGRSDEAGDLSMLLGGLDSNSDETVTYPTPSLRVGDEVSILIVDTDHVDPPERRSRNRPPIDAELGA